MICCGVRALDFVFAFGRLTPAASITDGTRLRQAFGAAGLMRLMGPMRYPPMSLMGPIRCYAQPATIRGRLRRLRVEHVLEDGAQNRPNMRG
jgi:hypothetical protein